jgi:hypothetical protein
MAYRKIDMGFFDYNWNMNALSREPEFINDQEYKELNRKEGFEMLHYINSLAKTWGWQTDNLSSFHNLERIIRNEVPENIRTHADILNWIEKEALNHFPVERILKKFKIFF